jgi:hydroxyethylthiazole kinase-like sugar kinase family protein
MPASQHSDEKGSHSDSDEHKTVEVVSTAAVDTGALIAAGEVDVVLDPNESQRIRCVHLDLVVKAKDSNESLGERLIYIFFH